MRLGLLVCFIFMVSLAEAQISNIPGTGNEVLRVQKQYTEIEGSPYLYEDWKPGIIVDKTGKAFPNVLLKYDIYLDNIEINQDGSVMILDTSLYPMFTISFAEDGKNSVIKHIFRSGFSGVAGYSVRDYFEVLEEGDAVLLKKAIVKYLEQNVSNYGTAANVKRFQRSDKYVIINNNNSIEVKLSSKSILSAFDDKRDELNMFVSKAKLKLKSESELVMLVNYYNSL